MRILHAIPQFPFFGGRTIIGGHASALLTLSLAQAAAGDEVTILSYVEGRAGRIEIAPNLVVHSLFERAHPGSVRYGLTLMRAAGRWTAPRRGDFDVVHSHSGFADYLLLARRLQRISRLPTLHTMYCPIPAEGGRWRLPIVHGALRRSAAALPALTAMSENVARSMRDFGLPEVRVIAPPVDIERFHPGDDAEVDAVRRELGLARDHVAVLFVGNAKPQKNLSGVLRAFARIRERRPQARLIVTTELAQSSPDDRLAALRQEMVDLGLEDAIIQRGIVDDMPALMRACDLLVAPFVDSFGPSDYFMAVLEAMASGKPTVVSAVGGMPEVISDDVGRLVDPHDDDAIAQAMDAFVGDVELRRATGVRARSYTETHFDPRNVAARFRRLYEECAA